MLNKTDIKISNCNCIKEANIEVVHGTLNIKYGYNGTGKTTISRAIFAKANNKDEELKMLHPYGNNPNNIEESPNIENMNFSKVRVFDESYVRSYLFKENSFLEDSFKVFLKSEECERLVIEIEQLLSDLQGIFQKSDDVQQLRTFLPKYFSAVKLDNGEISKRGGVGEFIKGNGGGFEKYNELITYKPFYHKQDMGTVSKWAKWRNDGTKQMKGETCPFCTTGLEMEKIQKQNELISTVFKNSALSTANAVLEYIKEAVKFGYIKEESVNFLDQYIGDSSKEDSLFAELQHLATETEYLFNKIEKIYNFRPMNVTKDELLNIESNLDEMIIEQRQLSKFYSTTFIIKIIEEIEEKINDLKSNTGRLKGLFNQHDNKIESLIETRMDDINHFFALAGFPYRFILKTHGENKAESYLVPIDLEENRISKPEERLSWGERNAFSLVMFMFEALSDNADLIVLDDPITSFDKNKKFAVVRRLFDNQKSSFRDKTLLMLTHDFQPIIDYIYGGFFNRFGLTTPVKAKWLQNESGIIKEHEIQRDDLLNTFKLTKEIAMDKDRRMHVRVVNLRKHIELMTPNFSETALYEVLSNLVHGRLIPENINKEKLNEDVFNKGCLEMAHYFEELSYDDIIEKLKVENLLKIIRECDGYDRIIAIRLLFQRFKILRSKLRKEYPAAYKFINETNHVENDYIFQLDPFKYLSIPNFYVDQLEEFINSNIKAIEIEISSVANT